MRSGRREPAVSSACTPDIDRGERRQGRECRRQRRPARRIDAVLTVGDILYIYIYYIK